MEGDAGVDFFVAKQAMNPVAIQKLFFTSVSSVSSVLSVVNLLPYSHDPRHR
jgi:hypothetical protein